MAIIFKNGRWIDSITGLAATSPMNQRTDEGLTSQYNSSMEGFNNLKGMSVPYESKTNVPYEPPKTLMDRFTQYGNPLADADASGNAVLNSRGIEGKGNWWELQAKDLGYGSEKEGIGKYFNSENIGNFAKLATAGGDIANAYSAFQTNKILKAEMEANNANSRANYAMGAQSYNDQADMRNQWLAAQGRDPIYNKAKTTYS